MKSGDDPGKFFTEIDEIVEVLASLDVRKDEESVCMKLLHGLAKECHDRRTT